MLACRLALASAHADTDDTDVCRLHRRVMSGAAVCGFTMTVSHRSKYNGERQDVAHPRVLPLHGMAFGLPRTPAAA